MCVCPMTFNVGFELLGIHASCSCHASTFDTRNANRCVVVVVVVVVVDQFEFAKYSVTRARMPDTLADSLAQIVTIQLQMVEA